MHLTRECSLAFSIFLSFFLFLSTTQIQIPNSFQSIFLQVISYATGNVTQLDIQFLCWLSACSRHRYKSMETFHTGLILVCQQKSSPSRRHTILSHVDIQLPESFEKKTTTQNVQLTNQKRIRALLRFRAVTNN